MTRPPPRGRRGAPEPSESAIARVLAENGIPIPQSLPEILANTGPVATPEPAPGLDLAARRARLAELRWPRRAVETAAAARDTPAIRAVQRWAFQRSLVLAGPKGTGKTVAAAWHALHDPRSSVMRFARAAEMVAASRFGEQWPEWLAAPALCIDDLGAEYADGKGSWIADLDLLVDAFYGDRRRLIVTTNLGGREFAERYGVRVRDRIFECAEWNTIAGESLRRPESSTEKPPWER